MRISIQLLIFNEKKVVLISIFSSLFLPKKFRVISRYLEMFALFVAGDNMFQFDGVKRNLIMTSGRYVIREKK